MPLTTRTQGSSTTPATDLYQQIATVLTNAGWVHIGQRPAARMGTNAPVEIWATSDTPESGGIWGTPDIEGIGGGCVVYIGVNNAFALTFYASEAFDDTLTAEPSANVFSPCPGDATGATVTPTNTYRRINTGQVLLQTPPPTATAFSTVGFVIVETSGAGFDYWLGADATRLLVANNSGGASRWAFVGRLEFLGTAGGENGVILAGGDRQGTNDPLSWIRQTTSGRAGNAKCSREPLTTTTRTGAFTFATTPTFPGLTTVDEVATGSPATNHPWHTTFVVSPCFLHGARQDAWSAVAARSHLGRMSDFVVFVTGATEPTIGDTITIGVDTYVMLGRACGNSLPAGMARFGIAVREAAF